MDIKPNSAETSPSLLFNHQNNHHPSAVSPDENPSPKKPLLPPPSNSAAGDRLKRDEWSEGAVSTLLEAYESKWVLRNRAKLKGHDWEDVARHVSSRANFTKSPKTQTQCKNKIESMKKRYRSESASAVDSAAASSWPLYHRLDLLLRGNTATPSPVVLPDHSPPPPVILLDAPPPPPAPPPFLAAQNSHGSNGVDRINTKELADGVDETRQCDQNLSEKNENNNNNNNIMTMAETDSSTPAIAYSEKEKVMRSKHQAKMKNNNKKKKSRMSEELDQIAGSIRWLAEVVVRSEQARMDMIRDIERMRAEAEAKRGEMDLKRTQIIANTQLEIAKLFAAAAKGVDSSLRIGRN